MFSSFLESKVLTDKKLCRVFYQFIQGNTLNLVSENIRAANVPTLIQLLNQNPAITTVDLSANHIGPNGARELADKLQFVTTLNLSSNDVGDYGTIEFAKQNRTILNVNLRGNKITDDGVIGFAKNNKIATQVDFSWNEIGTKGAIGFAKKNTIVTSVSFSRNKKVGNEGLNGFAKHNQLVTHANFCGTEIDDNGVIKFALINKIINEVDLSWNSLTTQCVSGLLQNKWITQLDIENNPLNQDKEQSDAVKKQIELNLIHLKQREIAWKKFCLLTLCMGLTQDSDIQDSVLNLIPGILELSGFEKSDVKGLKQSFMQTRFFKSQVDGISEQKNNSTNHNEFKLI